MFKQRPVSLLLQVDEERIISTGGRSSKGGTETVTTFKRTVIKQGYSRVSILHNDPTLYSRVSILHNDTTL